MRRWETWEQKFSLIKQVNKGWITTVKDLESWRLVGVCGTRMLRKKIYKGETGRRLADRFRKHLRDIEKNNTDASKPFAPHFNLPNHSHHNMTTCGLSLHHRNTESRKSLEQKSIFQLGTLSPHRINEPLSFH